MKRTLTLLCIATSLCYTAPLHAQSDSVKQAKVERINPYSSIKTSVFIEQSFGDYINSGTAVGLEVRKFTGLRHFFFATASVGQYKGHESFRSSSPTSYNLSYNTVKFRLGTTVGKELYNFYVGSSYLFDARLSETFYSIVRQRQVTATGDVTPYIYRLAPFAGACLKVRVLKIFLIEGYYEYGLLETFKPLKNKWAVPSAESPFFYRKAPSLLKMGGISIHVKI